jgi:signal transduction histidine kinase
MAGTGIASIAGMAGGMANGLLRRIARDRWLIAPLLMALLFVSLVAAAWLEVRRDRGRALEQATRFEQARAADLARLTAAALDRYARLGLTYADYRDGEIAHAEPAIRNIAVFDAGGTPLAVLDGVISPLPKLPRMEAARVVFPGGLAFRDGRRIVMVLFDLTRLVPGAVMSRAALLADGRPLVAGPDWRGSDIRAAVPGWPLTIASSTGRPAAENWLGSLPLYLLLILGPAVAGGFGAALLVGRFERGARRTKARGTLLGTTSGEAKLLVRLANAERGAAEATRSKSEFIAHMSHELRTPLNAIIGFSDIIAHGFYGPAGHPKYGEYAQDIGDAGRSLHAKIGDILEFSNIEAGRQPLSARPVDLAALAEECIAEHQGRAFSRRVGLAAGVCEPGQVRADAAAVKRIFANLIANALTYTAEGGVVRLEVHFEEGAGVAVLRDSGMGFSPTERKKAGRPFQRFDRPGTVTGAGLGLAIAVELARRMGGAMRLASQPGGGSVMELRLPRA